MHDATRARGLALPLDVLGCTTHDEGFIVNLQTDKAHPGPTARMANWPAKRWRLHSEVGASANGNGVVSATMGGDRYAPFVWERATVG